MWRKKRSDEIEYAIRVVGVERSFGSGERAVRVLRGVDLDVLPGELVGLYGPSGSGKTTLLNLIGVLDYPTAGEIYIKGKRVTRWRNRRRARLRRQSFGFIFQNYTLMPTYTALENIDLALRLPGLNAFQRHKRAKAALEAVGLSAWSSHYPDQLSGGQRQRVAIARAIASRPALILADEPTSGLDTRTSRRIMHLFKAIAREYGTAFLIVSHDPIVVEFVDKAYDLDHGKIKPRVLHRQAVITESAPAVIEADEHDEADEQQIAEIAEMEGALVDAAD